jgi:dTDP-4-amino-4,6-dideoxygalactose transaminase
MEDMKGVTHGYSYFPILVDEDEYGISRDQLYEKLKTFGINGRRYFYPLISNFSPYSQLPSASKENLLIANRAANQILCLPIYVDLSLDEVKTISSIIKK